MEKSEQSLMEIARDLAKRAHEGQTRDGSGEPYFEHCRRVAEFVEAKFGAYVTDEVVAAAYLHDVLEDCGDEYYTEIYEKCGPVVAALVEMLTKPEKRHFRNKRYLARIEAGPPELLLIKIADRVDNLSSLQGAGWSRDRLLYYLEDSQRIWDIAHKRHMGKQARHLIPKMTALAELLTEED